MPAPEPTRIIYIVNGQTVAEVNCTADGVLAVAYNGAAQLGYLQIGSDGSATLACSNGGTAGFDAAGNFTIDPGGSAFRLPNLPTGDPVEWAKVYQDTNGFLKVSAG